MAKTIAEGLNKIFESFEYEEGRHMTPTKNKTPIDSTAGNIEQEPTFADSITRKISGMQNTISEIQKAIDNEHQAIKNGHISSINGMEKIKGWQNRLSATQYKMQMLQKALDAYTQDQSEDNELKLKIAAAQNR